MRVRAAFTLIVWSLSTTSIAAPLQAQPKQDATALAQKTPNPVADLISVPL